MPLDPALVVSIVTAALTVALSAYALGHYFGAALFLVRDRSPVATDGPSDAAVTVVLPARNEGMGVIAALEALVAQTHRGRIEVQLLLNDRGDTSVPHLALGYPECAVRLARGATLDDRGCVVLHDDPLRRLVVVFTGVDGKAEKINHAVPSIQSPFVAVLDADHRADPEWIAGSLERMRVEGARMVQGVRRPLHASGFFATWDALHQHVGCELFNHAFRRLGLTVFFTGSTAVMDAALLRAHPFRRSLTEDVEFSYETLLQGVRIAYHPGVGSTEAVSPDLYSFLARRRRWAHGHTAAFFRHLPQVVRSRMAPLEKLQFLFHGVHYVLALGVYALHLTIGASLFWHLSPFGRAAACVSALLAAGGILSTQTARSLRARVLELGVIFGWILPATVIAMNLLAAWVAGNLARAQPPVSAPFQTLSIVGFVAPLVVLLVGLHGFRQASLRAVVSLVLSYPLAFYLNQCGVLLGMTDWLARRGTWHPVSRATLARERGWRWEILREPARWAPATLSISTACAGVFFSPTDELRVEAAPCQTLPHDGDPWIVRPDSLEGYCDPVPSAVPSALGQRSGTFVAGETDELGDPDSTAWSRLDSTFPCNEAHFSPENVVPSRDGGLELRLEARATGDRAYSSASIATVSDEHLYGRYEATLRPAPVSGVITAFFLYRFDPWQEIDIEFLGRDPSKVLFNVYYNPGVEGDTYNYGYRGTPVLVDLGFDASLADHRYAIEWEREEIRFFVDDRLLHRRAVGRPTPIPHLPMRVHVNVWPMCSEELAGAIDAAAMPASAFVRSVTLSRWLPPSEVSWWAWWSGEAGRTTGDWREDAAWIQPRPEP